MKTIHFIALCAVIGGLAPTVSAESPVRVEAVQTPPPQIEVDSKFFTITASAAQRLGLTHSLGEKPRFHGILSAQEFNELISLLSAEKDLNLLSSPAVTTKSGQRAVVEVIREFRYPTSLVEEKKTAGILTPTQFETRNIGASLEIEPTLGPGDLVDLDLVPSLTAFHRFVAYEGGRTANPSPIPKAGFTQPIFDVARNLVSATLRPGETLLLNGAQWNDSREFSEILTPDVSKPAQAPLKEPGLLFVTITAKLIKPRVPSGGGGMKAPGPMEISTQLVDVARDQLPESIFPRSIEPSNPDVTVVAGVFDAGHADELPKWLRSASGIGLSDGPTKIVAPGGQYFASASGLLHYRGKSGDAAGGKPSRDAKPETEQVDLQLKIAASSHPEGTIDLDISARLKTSPIAAGSPPSADEERHHPITWKYEESEPADWRAQRTITTSVSVFSGSTVMLLRNSQDQKDQRLQILLITVKNAVPGGASEPPTSAPEPPAELEVKSPAKGIPVPGKPGYITSPFEPKKGFIDVRGFPAGTEVKDPYSGNVIIVP